MAGKYYGGRTDQVHPPQVVTGNYGSVRGFRRNAYDFHATTTSHVHRPDDLLVLHRGITLHEEDLVRAGVVDLLELRRELVLGVRGLVDEELRTRQDLEH